MNKRPWKHYLILTMQSIIAIYLATFCLGIFYIHRGEHWIIPTVLLGLGYVYVLYVSIKRLIVGLPMEILMIAAPTVPLIILLLVIAMLPILRFF